MIGYDVKRMYHQARGFQLAAERCLEIKENAEQKWLPIQAIVCYAFACEIFMKAICIFENTKVHGHYLDELFDRLPPKYQMQLLKKLSVTYSELQIKHLLQQFKKYSRNIDMSMSKVRKIERNLSFYSIFPTCWKNW